ncbi:oxygen-dependent coproporphyrinogen oxidase [Carboxylicivirga linearis]|uniref:coproporphyrinogen oxidase n=1 Tax=Carboxylicivirga linearis TaxID=1628157 RepID=A0ABS5JVF2_9BACT|nr:oxygen-dependent coproporphyrinogen oxidase [Carboxylicivirga linearis]MBS2098898.1 oxygen-dependent coproporphyrinogen oxidase [Carboxylicivirga linearis]
MINSDYITEQFEQLQQNICKVLDKADGKTSFKMNPWQKDIGRGVSGVMQDGKYIEKAAVNFSKVSGPYTKQMAQLLGEDANNYTATGVSSILHPINVHVPIIHMNVRYFELDNGISWFGGGIDLTPHYIIKEDAQWFHQQLKKVCDKTYPNFYERFKPWADDYFFLPHRNETRGVGGIFYDRIKPDEKLSIQQLLNFSIDLGELYPKIYSELIQRHGDKPVSEEERKWQLLRRGRYVEFNLVHDRGTKFGLVSGGNTESILLSMPPDASWEYMQTPIEGSREAETQKLLKKEIDWINIV